MLPSSTVEDFMDSLKTGGRSTSTKVVWLDAGPTPLVPVHLTLGSHYNWMARLGCYNTPKQLA